MIGQFVNITNPVGNTIFVDAMTGNDTYAQGALTSKGGAAAYPFLTIANAISAFNNAVSNYGWTGGSIKIGPGTFAQGATQVIFPANCTVVGAGKYATVLSSTNTSGVCFSAEANTVIDSLTLSAVVGDSNFRTPFGWTESLTSSLVPLGVILRNCYVVGDSDALYIQKSYSGGPSSLTCYDCSFASSYDSFESATSSGHGWTCDFWNCDFTSTGPDLEGANIARGIFLIASTSAAPTLARFYGCRITATNGNGTTYGAGTSGAYTTIELHGCRVSTSSSTGTVYDLYNGGGTLSIDEATQYATSSGILTPLSAGIAGSAPATNAYSAPSNVYGSATALLGTPRAWKSIALGGTTYNVPLF
jgi:hypothetical protein